MACDKFALPEDHPQTDDGPSNSRDRSERRPLNSGQRWHAVGGIKSRECMLTIQDKVWNPRTPRKDGDFQK